MAGKMSLRAVSGIAMVICVLCVAAQSLLGMDLSHGLYYWTILIAVFGFLFLTSDSDKKEDSPWWW